MMGTLHTNEKLAAAAKDLARGATPVPDGAPEAMAITERANNFAMRIRQIAEGAVVGKTELVGGKLVFSVVVPRVFTVTEDGSAEEVTQA